MGGRVVASNLTWLKLKVNVMSMFSSRLRKKLLVGWLEGEQMGEAARAKGSTGGPSSQAELGRSCWWVHERAAAARMG